ncbi:MAG TPA: hypothetical protein VGJ22_05695 [Anaerolineales bacterium]
MSNNIHSIVRRINRELVPQFEERLRSYLAEQDRDWLIEQIVRLTLDAHSLEEMDRKFVREMHVRRRAERMQRVKAMALDPKGLADFVRRYKGFDRERLIAEKYLSAQAPAKGLDLIAESFRTDQGNALLQQAKDILFTLLFGDEQTNTHFQRKQQELLTLNLPSSKAGALDFMKASTEYNVAGTWNDPDNVSNDQRAENLILEVEYGEVDGELIGDGIVLTLSLINNLEVNEQILYARMINLEQSTLID